MVRIAIVDDSKLIRVFAAAALQKAGHEILQVEPDSFQNVLDTLIEWKPALIVLDQSMPAFQGPSLIRACFEHPELSTIKVLILTALHDEIMADRMKKLGVETILYKPIPYETLIEAVNRMLQGPPKGE